MNWFCRSYMFIRLLPPCALFINLVKLAPAFLFPVPREESPEDE